MRRSRPGGSFSALSVTTAGLEYTVISDAVNLAAKLEKATKDQGVRAHTTQETYDIAVTQGYVPPDIKETRAAQPVDGVEEAMDLVVLAA